MTLLFIVSGIVCLYLGGEALVSGGVQLGKRFGVSPLIIGLTVVSFGTSMPELATTIEAASGGATDMAFGNVVGSNIANIGLVLGTAALLAPLKTSRTFLRRDVPAMLVCAVALWPLALDGTIEAYEAAASWLAWSSTC